MEVSTPGRPRGADGQGTVFVRGMRVGVPDSPAGTFQARAYAHQSGKASPPGVPAGECGTPTRSPVMTGSNICSMRVRNPARRDENAKGTNVVPGMRVGVPDSPAGTFKARACAHQNGKASPPGVPAGECGTPARSPVMTGSNICSMRVRNPARRDENAKGTNVVPGMRVGVPDSPAGTFKARACAHQNGKASPPGVPAGECGTPARSPVMTGSNIVPWKATGHFTGGGRYCPRRN